MRGINVCSRKEVSGQSKKKGEKLKNSKNQFNSTKLKVKTEKMRVSCVSVVFHVSSGNEQQLLIALLHVFQGVGNERHTQKKKIIMMKKYRIEIEREIERKRTSTW